jgi:hypothetical protein
MPLVPDHRSWLFEKLSPNSQNPLADKSGSPYRAASLGNGLADGAAGVKILGVSREEGLKNFLLSSVGFTRFRAPIESPKWFRGKPLAFLRWFLAV